jgi:maltooligosyltrehalose trehalohydrolase
MKRGSVVAEETAGKPRSFVRAEKPSACRRHLPIGAEVVPGRGVHFRVWAPNAKAVSAELSSDDKAESFDLSAEEGGYFSGLVEPASAGMLYRYRLGKNSFPDPASRFQPEGPHGPSQIVDPGAHKWTDQSWKGPPERGLVIYEMHIGTYTAQATYAAAAKHLPGLAEFGINLIEIMPVADFPGRFGWGYDGVNLFAPTRLYGTPDDLRAFVNQAHQAGIGVILDVVYNHLGPDGNYLKAFAEHYFTDRHKNEWGQAINFDDKDSRPVREFFISNAAYWIDEFHFDGLRLDATQQMFDDSKEHIVREINRAARKAAHGRRTYLVAENEVQHARLVRAPEKGGYELDALWNDDFHHTARVALTGNRDAYYVDYKGTPQELISAVKHGFLFQGQWYLWQKKNRGKPALDLKPAQLVHFIENHDQIANSLHGRRIWQVTSPGKFKAMTALLLLGPQTPLLFQGQEFAASSPFVFFADHNPELARLVAAGRREFLRQFRSIACPEAEPYIADPGGEKTFEICKLNHADREKNSNIYEMHRDLLRIRREDAVIANAEWTGVDGAVLGPDAFVVRFFGENGDDRLLLVNLGRDLDLSPAPEPLLAPPEDAVWRVKWASESTCYGGCGTIPLQTDERWELSAETAVLLDPKPCGETDSTH